MWRPLDVYRSGEVQDPDSSSAVASVPCAEAPLCLQLSEPENELHSSLYKALKSKHKDYSRAVSEGDEGGRRGEAACTHDVNTRGREGGLQRGEPAASITLTDDHITFVQDQWNTSFSCERGEAGVTSCLTVQVARKKCALCLP